MIAGAIGTTTAIIGLCVLCTTLIGVIATAGVKMYRSARRIEIALAYVESEMRHNGGSTLRDQVKRIEEKVDLLDRERNTA